MPVPDKSLVVAFKLSDLCSDDAAMHRGTAPSECASVSGHFDCRADMLSIFWQETLNSSVGLVINSYVQGKRILRQGARQVAKNPKICANTAH